MFNFFPMEVAVQTWCYIYYAGVITWVYKHLLTLLFLTIVRKIHRKNAEPGQYFTLHPKEKAKVKDEENEADNHVWLRKRLAIL